MSIDAMKESFEYVELFDKPALFTNSRIDASTIPKGFYCYNLRGSDNDPGRPISLELYVGVNHAGTVLTMEPVKIPKSGYIRLREGLNFLGKEISLKEFCEEYKLAYQPRLAIRPASNDEAGIFYAQTSEQDKQMGAIGHVRIDFGQTGREFWHTWHPRGEESLNSISFKEELGWVVDQLRDSILKDLNSMSHFCYEHSGQIGGGWRQNYGYIVETENYRYCLRCSPGQGDYHAYLTCFDLTVQRSNLAKENADFARSADNWKKGVLEQLSSHREQMKEKDAIKPKIKQTDQNEPNL